MSVVRVVKNNQYTVIHNSPLQDTRLSLKARGLLAYCFSLPENWSYSIEGLVKAIGSDGRESIRAGLKELENCGYLKRRRLHDATGKFTDTEYIIYETAQMTEEEKEDAEIKPSAEAEEPITENPTLVDFQGFTPITENPTLVNPTLEKPTLANPTSGKPTSENRLQQNKYIQSKYKQSKYKTTTTTEDTEKPTETDNALPDEINDLAKRCCVSEKTADVACEKFGVETVKRHLVYMTQQSGIKNPNAWLMHSLRESWDVDPPPGNLDCPECRGEGFILRYYDDLYTGTKQELKLRCSKCRSS